MGRAPASYRIAVMSTSFTGSHSIRYPAPDVARGFMLLLIAVANVPFWTALFPASGEGGAADQWWVLIRQLFVDHRAYPLFSLLFGFGLMTMIRRRHDAHVAARTRELDESAPGLSPEARDSWIAGFEKEALESGRALVRRRGWWMLLFGAVHALFFMGDIIGTYALVAVLSAGLIAGRRWRLMIVIGIVQQALGLAMLLLSEFAADSFANTGMHAANQGGNATIPGLVGWFYPLIGLVAWVPSTLFTLLLSQVLPAVFIGAALATTDLVSSPDRHRSLLLSAGILGLALGALMGAPRALAAAGFLESAPTGAAALHEFGGIAGAIGWLALLVLIAGPPRERLGAARTLLAAVGKRSMSAYVLQTFVFIAVFGVLGLSGVEGVNPLLGMGIAVAVWAVIALVCRVMEARGRARGPLEVLLRTAVAASAAPQILPGVPVVPSAQAPMMRTAMEPPMAQTNGGVGEERPDDRQAQG